MWGQGIGNLLVGGRGGECVRRRRGAAGQSAPPKEWPEGFDRHVPEWHELVCAIEGECRVVSESGTFDLSPGKLLLIDRGVEHVELPTRPPLPYQVFWCGLGHGVVRLDRTLFSPPATRYAGPSLEVIGRTDVESLAEAIGAEMQRRDWGWQRSVFNLLEYLSIILIRRLRRGSILDPWSIESPVVCEGDPHVRRVIRAALRFCAENFRRPVYVAEVAASVSYNPKHLNRLFSAHLGRSVSDHVKALRVSAARQMLESTNLSLAEIANAVGYSDHSHFTRAFKRATGCSPKAYRKGLVGR